MLRSFPQDCPTITFQRHWVGLDSTTLHNLHEFFRRHHRRKYMKAMWRKDRNTLSQLSSESREKDLLDALLFWKIISGVMAITY